MAPVQRPKCVVVTGASTGIGLGTVRVFIDKGYHVFGSVRKQTDADRLQEEFGEDFTPLLFDVCDANAIRAGAAKVKKCLNGHTLHGLVNNAGAAFYGPLMYQPIAEFRRNIDINLIGTLQVTQGAPGRIVMVSSVGGKFAAPFIGGYAASKHGLEGMSHSLRRELMLYGIDVIIVGPGAVVTPIWDKSEAQDVSMYDSTPYKAPLAAFGKLIVEDGRAGHSPEHIGRGIFKALTAKRPRVRYAIVANRLARWTLPLLLPVRLVDWLMASTLKLLPKHLYSSASEAPEKRGLKVH